MFKVKIIYDEFACELEKKINDFIKNKKVISISYAVTSRGFACAHECCILYEE